MLLSLIGGHNADPTGLVDSPQLEQDLADDRRAALESAAAAFDPEKLYALEIERDEAFDELVRQVPDHADVSVSYARHALRSGGKFAASTGWLVSIVGVDGCGTNQIGDTSTDAIAKAIREWQTHHPARRVRPAPVARWLDDEREALGQIDPATADELRAKLAERFNVEVFEIDPAGFVTVKANALPVCADEAQAMGEIVHCHIAATTDAPMRIVPVATTTIEPRPAA
jgi:hypothetical protein